ATIRTISHDARRHHISHAASRGSSPLDNRSAVRASAAHRHCAGVFEFFPVPPARLGVHAGVRKGIGFYFQTLRDPMAWSAIKLTFIAAAISVPLNCVFGVGAAWAIAKFDFHGKNILLTLIDLPFSV